MKRNEHIQPLSRDHHEGLLFCWKLRRGVQHGVATYRMRRYAAFFWEEHMKEHFREEEELLFNRIPDPAVDRALAEHREIKAAIDRISNGDEEGPETYTALADLVDRHIRFEERQLFPLLEEQLTPEQLTDIGRALHSDQPHHPTARYGDEFWNRKTTT